MSYSGDKSKFINHGLSPASSKEYACPNGHTWECYGDMTRFGFRPFGRLDICEECGERGEEVEAICNGCGGSGKRDMEMKRKCFTCNGSGVMK